MEQFERSTGVTLEPVVEEDDIPFELQNVWDTFTDLNSARSSNGFSPNPITFLDIKCWSELMKISLLPWEIQTLRDLDNLWLRVWNESQKKKS